MVVAFLAAFDERGKEAYFDEDPTERDIVAAINLKLVHPTWTMRTDDWGYIRRVYEDNKDGTNNRWKEYNVFLAICITAAVCGAVWIFTNLCEVKKFGKSKWRWVIRVRLRMLRIVGTNNQPADAAGIRRWELLHPLQTLYLGNPRSL
ncbi:MAG: hypothetical protein P4M11_14445 [Candidatus Pacebacteria bacterium]|nr:hypothetical protein [Candidatus Paceibacterota bacterium]